MRKTGYETERDIQFRIGTENDINGGRCIEEMIMNLLQGTQEYLMSEEHQRRDRVRQRDGIQESYGDGESQREMQWTGIIEEDSILSVS